MDLTTNKFKTFRKFFNTDVSPGWQLSALIITIIVLAPVVTLVWHALNGNTAHWSHLVQFVLPATTVNTVILLTGVGILVGFIGVGSAWLISAYEFPTRNILSWALFLPLAVPTYIIAFAYLDILHPIGPVQTLIRDILGYTSPRQFRLPDIRSLSGAIFLLGFVLYPYVYLSTRVMFASQSASFLEASRILGETATSTFFRVALPMARPAIAVGVSLALLETLNDIGASEFLGVQTLTVSVYTTWVTRSDLAGAAQIALTMLVIVVALILVERYGRRKQRYSSNMRSRNIKPFALKGIYALIAIILGWLPIVIGFVAPAIYLLNETIKHFKQVGSISDQLISSAFNTVKISIIATIATLICGLTVVWAARIIRHGNKFKLSRILARVSTIGYALPGTVLAIGMLTPIMLIENLSSEVWWFITGLKLDLILINTSAALVCAYVIRFLAISIGGIESGLSRIPPSLEQASRLLGETSSGTLRRVHLPLLRPAMGAAALLIFVDSMKELPATLLLRPINFETLATWLYAEAARGTYEEGAVAALAIVITGLLPVILIAKTQFKTT